MHAISARVCRNTEGKICTAANLSTGTKHMFGLELCMVGSNFSCACGLERVLVQLVYFLRVHRKNAEKLAAGFIYHMFPPHQSLVPVTR